MCYCSGMSHENNLQQAHFWVVFLFIKVSCYFNIQFSFLIIRHFLHIMKIYIMEK